MRDYIISTDSTADLLDSYVQEHNIAIHPLYYYVNEELFGAGHELPMKEFYNSMREGANTKTSASNPEFIMKKFTEQVEAGYEVLHLSFSSGLSCSYQNAVMCANEVLETHPDAKITVIDTLCAAPGQGLIVYLAVKMKEEGKTLDEVAQWVVDNRLHICHQFTVEDLKYLWRGGRISKSTQILGTLINVKPVLHVDDEGHLIPLSNVRGRKKSLNTLIENMGAHIADYPQDIAFIGHGDCLEDAEYVAEEIKSRYGVKEVVINYLSPTIGAHAGPGTVALFHLGDTRSVQ